MLLIFQCQLFWSTPLTERVSSCGQIWGLGNKDRTSILAKLECLLFDNMPWDFLPSGSYGSISLLNCTLTSVCQNPAPSCKAQLKYSFFCEVSLIHQPQVSASSFEAPKNSGHLFWLIWVYVGSHVFCAITIFRLKIPEGTMYLYLSILCRSFYHTWHTVAR